MEIEGRLFINTDPHSVKGALIDDDVHLFVCRHQRQLNLYSPDGAAVAVAVMSRC